MRESIESVIQHELQSKENLLWAGSPKNGLILHSNDVFLIPFSLLWGGFAIFWESSVIKEGAPFFFALWGIPFVLVGLYLILGRFFVDAWNRKMMVYGVTTQRVIIISGLLHRTVKSLSIQNLGELTLTEMQNRSGDITFGTSIFPMAFWMRSGWPGAGKYAPPAFELIDNARHVYDLIRQAQNQAQRGGSC